MTILKKILRSKKKKVSAIYLNISLQIEKCLYETDLWTYLHFTKMHKCKMQIANFIAHIYLATGKIAVLICFVYIYVWNHWECKSCSVSVLLSRSQQSFRKLGLMGIEYIMATLIWVLISFAVSSLRWFYKDTSYRSGAAGHKLGQHLAFHYLINSIWPVLCLQTKSAVFWVWRPFFPSNCPIQEVGGIELNARLCGAQLQNTPCPRMNHSVAGAWDVCVMPVMLKINKEPYGRKDEWFYLAHFISCLCCPGSQRQKLWSNPGPGSSLSRDPRRTDLRRSKSEFSTGLISPVKRDAQWIQYSHWLDVL